MGGMSPWGLSQGLRRMFIGGDVWVCQGLRAQESVEDPKGSQRPPVLQGCVAPRPLEGARPECVPSYQGQQSNQTPRCLVWDRVGSPLAGGSQDLSRAEPQSRVTLPWLKPVLGASSLGRPRVSDLKRADNNDVMPPIRGRGDKHVTMYRTGLTVTHRAGPQHVPDAGALNTVSSPRSKAGKKLDVRDHKCQPR